MIYSEITDTLEDKEKTDRDVMICAGSAGVEEGNSAEAPEGRYVPEELKDQTLLPSVTDF